MNTVDALSSRVKRTSDATRLPVMMNGLHRSRSSRSTLPPRITGRRGRTQGASTVSSPATSETKAVKTMADQPFSAIITSERLAG